MRAGGIKGKKFGQSKTETEEGEGKREGEGRIQGEYGGKVNRWRVGMDGRTWK